nr:hypothetical protein Iba_chr05cCG15400 [Ipomoea batatas]
MWLVITSTTGTVLSWLGFGNHEHQHNQARKEKKNEPYSRLTGPVPLVAALAIGRPQGATGVAFGRGIHVFRERGREARVEIHDLSDVVVELLNEADVSVQVFGGLGLVVLINLANQQPVVIQNRLNLHKALLKCLQNLPIYHLCPISQPGKRVPVHFLTTQNHSYNNENTIYSSTDHNSETNSSKNEESIRFETGKNPPINIIV